MSVNWLCSDDSSSSLLYYVKLRRMLASVEGRLLLTPHPHILVHVPFDGRQVFFRSCSPFIRYENDVHRPLGWPIVGGAVAGSDKKRRDTKSPSYKAIYYVALVCWCTIQLKTKRPRWSFHRSTKHYLPSFPPRNSRFWCWTPFGKMDMPCI